jgi:hypothetical protein
VSITAAPSLCAVCKQPMFAGQVGRHFACDPTSPAGRSCHCPDGCSDRAYGDGRVDCDKTCVPCRAFRGKPLKGGKA